MLPWKWKTRYYADIRLIGADLAVYTGAGSSPSKRRPPSVIDLRTGSRVVTPGLRKIERRKAAASVLLYPAQDERVLIIGGARRGTGEAIPHVDSIDYSPWPGRTPAFEPRAPLPVGMQLVLSVLLPNGQLFVTGGNRSWRTRAVRWAAIYDPLEDSWVTVDTPSIERGYHSTIMTGLDGRVSTFGGNPLDGSFEDEEEIYSPWYVSERRPEITEHAEVMTYGSTHPITVTLPPGTELGYLTLERARAETHLYVPNQSMVDLPHKVDAEGRVTVRVPVTAVPPPARLLQARGEHHVARAVPPGLGTDPLSSCDGTTHRRRQVRRRGGKCRERRAQPRRRSGRPARALSARARTAAPQQAPRAPRQPASHP